MLENWLKKVNPEVVSQISELNSETVAHAIKIHKQLFPSIDDCKVVLFSDNALHMDVVRQQYYQMYNHYDNIIIADLGDLRNTDGNFLINLFTELLESKVIPIILTQDQDLIHAFHFALNAFHQDFKSLHCSKRNAPYTEDDYANCKSVISLGVQGHLQKPSELESNSVIRLSRIKNQMQEAEPYTRNMDTICFDLNTVRHSEVPGLRDASPSGINADEMTQLFRYFGFNEQLKALFITNYDSTYDFNLQTAQLIAQGVWYFIEAKDQCISENMQTTEDFHEFLVDIEGLEEPISFIKAKKSGRWWIKSHANTDLIPCSYNDYLTACQNEIPDKLIF